MNPLGAPQRAHLFRRRGFDVDGSGIDAERRREPFLHAPHVGAQTRALRHDHGVHVAHTITMLPQHGDCAGEQADTVRAGPGLVIGREMLANIAQPSCPKESIDQGVGEHIGVGVAVQTGVIGDRDSAQDEGAIRVGAGETVRRKLLHECNVHTLLRLPTGMFYAQGVKCNVLFLERKPASEQPWTKNLWIYDLRTNQHFTLKTNPLNYGDLEDFVACYNPDDPTSRTETDRFKKFTYEETDARDKASLAIFWLRDESLEDLDNLPDPATLAAEIVEELEAALTEFAAIAESLEASS